MLAVLVSSRKMTAVCRKLIICSRITNLRVQHLQFGVTAHGPKFRSCFWSLHAVGEIGGAILTGAPEVRTAWTCAKNAMRPLKVPSPRHKRLRRLASVPLLRELRCLSL